MPWLVVGRFVVSAVLALSLLGLVGVLATVALRHSGAEALSSSQPSGTISTVAGNGTSSSSGDGGAATSAGFSTVDDVVADGSGNLFVSDSNRVRRVDAGGAVSTFAGGGTDTFTNGIAATSAKLWDVQGLAVGPDGSVYVADAQTFLVRKVSPGGNISTVAGTGSSDSTGGYGDGGAATFARVRPYSLAVDASGSLYISDRHAHRVRKVNTSGVISTVAGSGAPSSPGFSGDGGAATSAKLSGPRGVAISGSGELYIADTGNGRVRKVDAGGTIGTIAGSGSSGVAFVTDLGDGDGATGSTVGLHPYDVAVDGAGIVWVADMLNSRVRRVHQGGKITTLAGFGMVGWNGANGFSGDGSAANKARLNGTHGIALDESGSVFAADRGNRRVRAVWRSAFAAPIGGPLTTAELAGGGQGASCTSGGTRQVAAPIATATGEFWHTFPGMTIPGRGPGLDFNETYSTHYAAENGPLGYGWRHCYQMELAVSGSNATITQETGAQVDFSESGGVWSALPRVIASLAENGDGTWTFTRRDREIFTFNSTGQLIEITDLNGEATTLSYASGKLDTVTGAAGRTLTFAYTGSHLTNVTDSATPPRDVQFTYDGNGDLASVTDVNGGVTSFTYDGAHRMLTMLDPMQQGSGSPEPITNHYDGSGRIDWQDDQLNRRTSLTYGTDTTTVTDPAGNVTVERYVDGLIANETRAYGTAQAATWSYTYDPATLEVASVTDPNGHLSFYTYDADANPTSSLDALGRLTTTTFNSLGLPLTVTDPLGTTTTNTYDGSGNLTSTSTPLKNGAGVTVATRTTQLTYGDGAHPGDITEIEDPNGNTWTLDYDADGNLISETAPPTPENPAGNQTTYDYDDIGRITSMVPPAGNISGATPGDFERTFTYDPFGQQLSEAHAAMSLSSSATYRVDGLLASETDRNGNTTQYHYDLAGQLTTITRPDTTTLENGYDDNGNLTVQTDGAGENTTYHYDELDRVDWTEDPLARRTTFTYDGAGNLLTRTNPNGGAGLVTTFTYDAADQLANIAYSDGTTPNVTLAYDDAGRRVTMADGTGTTTYAWDTLSRLTSSAASIGGTVDYGYDLAGNITSLTYPGSKTITRHFDAAGRLDYIEDWLSPANRTTFAYDPNSNLTTTSFPNTTSSTNTYDDADRLVDITHKKAGVTFAAFAYTRDDKGLLDSVSPTGLGSSETYGYTDLDQLTTVNATPTYTNDSADNLTKLGASTFTYDDANQLATQVNGAGTTTYGHDHRGNRTIRTPSAGPPSSYTYDQASRLKTASGYTYTYNGDGLRLRKSSGGVNTNYTWDLTAGNAQLLSDGTSNFIYGPDGRLVEQVTGSTPQYLHQDQVGSTRLITDSAGNAAGTYTFDAYGNEQAHTGTAASALRFAGEYTDSETGFQYLRARHYDPSTGQFVIRDPISNETRSPYSYAASSPLNFVDPSGRCAISVRLDDIRPCREFVDRSSEYVSSELVIKGVSATGIDYFFEWRAKPEYRRFVAHTDLSVYGRRPGERRRHRIGFNTSFDRRHRRDPKPWYAHTSFEAARGSVVRFRGTMLFDLPFRFGYGDAGGSLSYECRVPHRPRSVS
jgi:RHS repeat-associated protein